MTNRRLRRRSVKRVRLFLRSRSNFAAAAATLGSLAWAISGWSSAPTMSQVAAVAAGSAITAGLGMVSQASDHKKSLELG